MVVIIWKLDLQLPVQSVPITTIVVRSNTAKAMCTPMQNYVIKFLSVIYGVSGFLRVFQFPPPIKLTERYN
jgi:hypothetical protein